jgi:hypothetical protein
MERSNADAFKLAELHPWYVKTVEKNYAASVPRIEVVMESRLTRWAEQENDEMQNLMKTLAQALIKKGSTDACAEGNRCSGTVNGKHYDIAIKAADPGEAATGMNSKQSRSWQLNSMLSPVLAELRDSLDWQLRNFTYVGNGPGADEDVQLVRIQHEADGRYYEVTIDEWANLTRK